MSGLQAVAFGMGLLFGGALILVMVAVAAICAVAWAIEQMLGGGPQ